MRVSILGCRKEGKRDIANDKQNKEASSYPIQRRGVSSLSERLNEQD